MRFWDTSPLAALCLREPTVPIVQGLLDQDPGVVVWWATHTECLSAIIRRARAVSFGPELTVQARARLSSLADQWLEVEPSGGVRFTAERLLAIYPLRAADAFQLAAALEWAAGSPGGIGFVCLDNRLREAARREGFAVLPEQV